MKNIFTLLPSLILLTFAVPNQSISQNIPTEEIYENLEWKFVGPYRGGRSTAISGVVSKPYTFYMGTTGGGVWKTTDAGNRWKNISDGQITVGSIGAVSVSESDENVIYVGTGSADPRGNISTGNGIFDIAGGRGDLCRELLKYDTIVKQVSLIDPRPVIPPKKNRYNNNNKKELSSIQNGLFISNALSMINSVG